MSAPNEITADHFSVNPTGFPLVRLPAGGEYVQFLPTTKYQFEYFLCRPGGAIRPERYDDMLKPAKAGGNPRVTPDEVNSDTYLSAVLTGLNPQEAVAFADWCSEPGRAAARQDAYHVPTAAEWWKVYAAAKLLKPVAGDVFTRLRLSDRAKLLLQQLGLAVPAKTLADQMLMRQGCWELVTDQATGGKAEYKVFGRPPEDFCPNIFNLDGGVPEDRPVGNKGVGVRLVRRGG